MIKNERQYKITKSQIARFTEALERVEASQHESRSRLNRLEADALRSQLDELKAEVARYEELQAAEAKPIQIHSLGELSNALIQARITAGLSQRDLAERMNLKEQQIQRYEATDYTSASLARLRQVAEALRVDFAGHMSHTN